MLSEQIVIGRRRNIVITDLIGIFGRRRQVSGEGNFVPPKLRCVHDVKFFFSRKRYEIPLSDKLACRFHGFLIRRKNLIDGRMLSWILRATSSMSFPGAN